MKRRVFVASENPVKVNATKCTFQRAFPNSEIEIKGVSAPSGVSDMPMDNDTYIGAKNRVHALRKLLLEKSNNNNANNNNCFDEHDYLVAIEGGLFTNNALQEATPRHYLQGVIIVMHAQSQQLGIGTTTAFELPQAIAQRVITEGKEVGLVIDEITGEANTKQKGGAIAYLTNGMVSRQHLYEEGMQMALVPFLQPHLFKL